MDARYRVYFHKYGNPLPPQSAPSPHPFFTLQLNPVRDYSRLPPGLHRSLSLHPGLIITIVCSHSFDKVLFTSQLSLSTHRKAGVLYLPARSA